MYLQAKKSLGQHFLKSSSVLKKIIDAAKISSTETVLEIGPGTGILTTELLKTSASIIAVEKDDRAYELLQEKYSQEISAEKLILIKGDILNIDLNKYNIKNGEYALVANIPYYITGAILEKFLEHEPRPNRIILLIQKEVAERIVARSHKESVLSVSVKAFGTPRIIANVPRNAFVPAPNVDSAIIEISKIGDQFFEKTKNFNSKNFFTLIKCAFAHKRKFALRNLEEIFDQKNLMMAWDKAGLSPKVRAEDIPVEKWLELTQILQ